MAFESALKLPEAFKSARYYAADSEGWQLQIQITVQPRAGSNGRGIYDQALCGAEPDSIYLNCTPPRSAHSDLSH